MACHNGEDDDDDDDNWESNNTDGDGCDSGDFGNAFVLRSKV